MAIFEKRFRCRNLNRKPPAHRNIYTGFKITILLGPLNIPMDPIQFERTIKQLQDTTANCRDCGLVCEGQPRRTLTWTATGWQERCGHCGLFRTDAGVFVTRAQFRAQKASGSDSSLQKQSSLQSLPTELGSSSCPDHHAVPAEPESDSVLDFSIHPCPVSRDPGDHLVLDISIHKC